MNQGTAVLEVGSVSKRYASVLAVDSLSFSVQPGQIMALLGPNGAGKSTTVRMLAGIIQPDSGELVFRLGGTSGRKAPAQQLGYLPEDRGLYADQRILPTLAYLAGLRGVDRQVALQRATAWLERFGLADRIDSKVSELSKGNQQKVQFIAGILHEPQLAILDEPFSGFDPVNQDLVSQIIRELRDAGMTIVLSAHHMDLVEDLADHILLMHQGRAVLHGTMAQIRAESGVGQRLNVTFTAAGSTDLDGLPGVSEVQARTASTARLALEPGTTVGSVLEQLTGRVELLDVNTDTPSLREIYLTTVGGSAA